MSSEIIMGYKNVTQEYHSGKKLRESNLLCVLTSVGTQPVNKRARVNSRSEFEYADSVHPKFHTHQVFRVSDIRSMGEFITELEQKPRSYLIYGLPNKELVPGDKILRRKVNFRDRKTKWLIIDFDSVLPPSWTNQTPPKETFDQLWSSLASIPGMNIDMPPAIWQLSNSWGDANKEVPKCHAFIELDNPISVARLRSWADYCRSSYSIDIDKAIYQRTQPIYTAKPTLIGTRRAIELNDLKRVYTKAKGTRLIASELILNLPEARDAQIPSEREGDAELFDYVLSRLEDEGLCRQAREGGKIDIICPLSTTHSGGNNDTSTTIWRPMDGKGPAFWCQHTNSHSNGKNGWQWFLSELTEQGIISQAEIHALAVSSAKNEFSIGDKHQSTWSIDEIQQNYIYIEQSGNIFSVSTSNIIQPTGLMNIHRKVWDSKEGKQAGDKPVKGMDAMMLSNSKHPGCKIVSREQFDPSTTKLISYQQKTSYLNAFRGFHVQPVHGDTRLFHNHIKLICPDSAEQEAFTDYLAHIIQCPWERPTWSPVHVSVQQGLGRGLLNQVMQQILRGYTSSPTPSDLFESQFNEYLKNTLWIGIEETNVRTGKGVAAKLKELITMNNANINGKHDRKLTDYPIYSRFFFMTNDLDALPIEESDRRFWVIGPSEAGYQKRRQAYYDKFAKAVRDPSFQSHVMYDLLHRDLKNFSPHQIPFRTSLKANMQRAAQSPIEKALNRIRECKYFQPFMDPTQIKKLIEEYMHNHHHVLESQHLRQVMQRLPQWADGKQIRINGKGVRLRILYGRKKYSKYSNKQVQKLMSEKREIPLDWYND